MPTRSVEEKQMEKGKTRNDQDEEFLILPESLSIYATWGEAYKGKDRGTEQGGSHAVFN